MIHTIYNNSQGDQFQAITITWAEAENILGRPHQRTPRDERMITRYLHHYLNAPGWVVDAEHWANGDGIGYIGPRIVS